MFQYSIIFLLKYDLYRRVTKLYKNWIAKQGECKMLKNVKSLFPLNLQFFAEDADNGNNAGSNDLNDNGSGVDNAGQNDSSANNQNTTKTFTQEQVSNMMAKEKNEGKRSILKSLGFKTEDEAKKAMELYNALLDSQKSEEQKNQESLQKANTEKEEYRLRAEQAENKVLCLEHGVDKNSIEDVLAIAYTKVTAGKDLGSVLNEMSKQPKYSTFFGSSDNSGTGNEPKHNGTGSSGIKNYGKELAERTINRNQSEKKSSYF